MAKLKRGKSVPAAQMRAEFAEYLHRVQFQGDRISVTLYGRFAAALIGPEDVERLEMLDELSLSKKALAALKEGDNEVLSFGPIYQQLRSNRFRNS